MPKKKPRKIPKKKPKKIPKKIPKYLKPNKIVFWPKIPCGLPTISALLSSTSIKSLRSACTATSYEGRWI